MAEPDEVFLSRTGSGPYTDCYELRPGYFACLSGRLSKGLAGFVSLCEDWGMSPTGSFEQRLKAVRQLLNDFRPERRIHLAVSISSLIVQIVFFVVFWSNDQVEWTHFLALAGPGGMIVVTGNRILRMWNDTLRYLHPSLPAEGVSQNE